MKAKSDPLSQPVKFTVQKSIRPKNKIGQVAGRGKYKEWNPNYNNWP